MLKFIVTGCGRSGSVYMSRILNDVGIPCGHESIFNQEKENHVLQRFYGYMPPTISKCSDNHGWVDLSKLQADSSYMAVPYLNYKDVKNVPIIHIVRNPFAVISSFVLDLEYFKLKENNTFNDGKWEEWIFSHTPELNLTTDPVERACLYYISWNERIEKCKNDRPYWFQKVEGSFCDKFFEFLGIPPMEVGFKNKRINSKKQRNRDLTADNILNSSIRDKFLEIVSHYGYPVKPISLM